MWSPILRSFIFAIFSLAASGRGLTLPIVDDRTPVPIPGRVCAYGDMDKDRYTDLVVQRGNKLFILLQSEAGVFKEDSKRGYEQFELTIYLQILGTLSWTEVEKFTAQLAISTARHFRTLS
jgi:hypothetical protein